MPVTADQVAEISRNTVDLYKAAERAVLDQVTRRLNAGMDAPDWAVRRLGALATLRNVVGRILQLVGLAGGKSIREALARAYRRGQAEATTGIPARLLPRDPDAARAPALLGEVPRASVIENLAAALVADIGRKHANVLRDLADGYRKVVAEAVAASVAGGITRRQASQIAYQRLVDRGITGFTDVSGRRWRLSSYVEMAVRTVTQRAAVQGQVDKQLRLGLPFVIVSDEAGECVLCRPYEGQVLRIDDGPTGRVEAVNPATGETVIVNVVATLAEAVAAGLQHPNCRHSIRTYLPGVTKLPERPTADPDGDAARQRQRQIERHIRRWKERDAAALDPAAKRQARARVRMWQAEMRDHLAANPALKRLAYREAIGAGNVPPAGTTSPRPAPKPVEVKTVKASYADRLKQATAGPDALDAPKLSLVRTDTHDRLGNRGGLTADQRTALVGYQGADFRPMNAHFHALAAGKDPETSARVLDLIRHLDEAMAKSALDRDVVLWRGFRRARRTFGELVDGNLTGAEWTENAYLSASSEEREAKAFAISGSDAVLMRILVPAGSRGVQISGVYDDAGIRDEAEILLNRGTKLRVVADYGIVGSARRLDVEVLG